MAQFSELLPFFFLACLWRFWNVLQEATDAHARSFRSFVFTMAGLYTLF